MKWSLTQNFFTKTKGTLHLLPEVCIWYDKYYFLETGIHTPAFGIHICWIKWKWLITLQKIY